MVNDIYDLCVIGGGINGAGIARDAAGRGLKVLLLEARDLASGTSSKSTKLIHGGLRYLENFDFKLVREALKERETLLKLAPHIISPLKFVLPHTPAQRPFWMINIGLFLYDRLAKRQILPASEGIKLREHRYGTPLEREYKKGIIYSDCWVEDSRLVVLNAMDAKANGAEIKTYTICENLECEEDAWKITARDAHTGSKSTFFARMAVNAGGPWAGDILAHAPVDPVSVPHLRLVKGSHIITDRLYAGNRAYVLQQPDGRIVFVLPYEKEYTLIGTTEEEYTGDPYEAQISDQELEYLINAYNADFKSKITVNDVLWAYSGVRPLFDDGAKENRKVSRDHRIHKHEGNDGKEHPPIVVCFWREVDHVPRCGGGGG